MDEVVYQNRAIRTAKLDWDARNERSPLVNGVMGLAGEAGECVDMLKKHLFQGHELDTDKMALELGDVLWYIALAAYSMGYGLDEIMTMNIAKLAKRYPNGFSTDDSLNREESND